MPVLENRKPCSRRRTALKAYGIIFSLIEPQCRSTCQNNIYFRQKMVRSHCWFTLSSHFMMKSKLMVTRERSWLQRWYSVRLKQERRKSNIYQMCLEKLHPWAHSASPLKKHRFGWLMSLYSKTAFTSNFQTNTAKIWSNSQGVHLPSTIMICLLRERFWYVWFPDLSNTVALAPENLLKREDWKRLRLSR